MMTPSAEEAAGDVSPDIDIEKGSDSTAASETKKKSTASKKEKEFETETPSLLRFVLLARPELPALLTSLFLVLAADGVNLVVPIVIARAYDALVSPVFDEDERGNIINQTMILVLVLTAVGSILGWIRGFLQGLIGERVVARMRLQLYRSVLFQDISFFDEHKSGEIVSRLGSDATLLQASLSTSVPEVLSGMSKAIVCVILMFYLSVRLTSVTLGGVVLISGLSVPLGKALGDLSRRYQDALGVAQTRSTETIGSMRTVQSFVAEEKEFGRFADAIGDPDKGNILIYPKGTEGGEDGRGNTLQVGFSKATVTSTFFTLMFGGGVIVLYLSLWYGFHLVNGGWMSIGDLTAFQSYVFQVAFAIGQAAGNIAKLIEGIGASGRMLYLINRTPAIPKLDAEKEPFVPNERMRGDIEFNNVSFAYASRPDNTVLKDYSLTIPANTTTALVGSSGGGKSTVVSLLQRFYDISGGSITIDGHEITDLDLSWLRSNIGFVQQEPHLFGLTVRDNLLYGVNREVSQKELESVCRDANCLDFIESWPEHFETMVGEKGVKLSGGQKQRISIARALLTDCRILLLDEATSALDAESEHLVQSAIENLMLRSSRTVIIVAHRLSTVQKADQIVVMHDHKIAGVGSHQKLLEENSRYKDLIKRQSVMTIPLRSTSSLIEEKKSD